MKVTERNMKHFQIHFTFYHSQHNTTAEYHKEIGKIRLKIQYKSLAMIVSDHIKQISYIKTFLKINM